MSERMDNYASMRLSPRTRKILRLIAANTGETIIEVAERIATTELQKMGVQDEWKESDPQPEAV